MRCHNAGLGSCAFARHYLRNHFCFLFLRVLRCFSSPGSLRAWHGAGRSSRRVAPFGNPRITGYLLLHAAYRSLSRPSSPPRAKASFMCPSLLSFFFIRKVALDNLLFVASSLETFSACCRFSFPEDPCRSPVRFHGARIVLFVFLLTFYVCCVARDYLLYSFTSALRPPLRSPSVSNMSMSALFRVENNGFEPLTLCLQSRCSSQLS